MTIKTALEPAPLETTDDCGFSYACRRCDVFGRVKPRSTVCCWVCGLADRLERR